VFHPDITRRTDIELALEAANGAMVVAGRQQTRNAGSVTIPNVDGTKTVIGVDAGGATVAKWVGDVTPPGKPTGVTASSRNAALWVSWDGSLDGGIPSDFDHVEFTATSGSTSVDLGALREAGTVTAAGLTVGASYSVTAVAYDDAHAEDGSAAPNASGPSDPVTVTVASAVSPEDLEQAQANAQNALNQLALTASSNMGDRVDSASASAGSAVSTANAARDAANSASSTAQTALSNSQSALQDTINSGTVQYAVSTSSTTSPTTGWSAEQPDWSPGRYIWFRSVFGYGSGDYTYTSAALLTGNQGVQGEKGDPGEPGANGTSVTIKGHVATASSLPAAASAGDGYLTDDDGHLHVYGTGGWVDVGVIRGANGTSAYIHTAYANSADGTADFSTTLASGRSYLGTYTDSTQSDSTTPGDYAWTRTKGDTGAQGVSQNGYTPYYALASSAPAQPASSAPPSPWSASEPAYQPGMNLYTCVRISYDNGSYTYTPVQLSSSYSAAAVAINNADSKTLFHTQPTQPTAQSTNEYWFKTDPNGDVIGFYRCTDAASNTWGSVVLIGDSVLVPGSVGAITLTDGAVTAPKITASEELMAKVLSARKIDADDIDAGTIATAIAMSDMFRTTDGHYGFDSANGFWAGDPTGLHVALTEASNGVSELAIMHGTDVISSLRFIDTISTDGYVHTGIYTGQNGQLLEFATLVDSANHSPDPLSYDVRLSAALGTGRMLLDAQYAVNLSGTWFAHGVGDLPTVPSVAGGSGTRAFAGGVDYVFDGAGMWVPRTQTLVSTLKSQNTGSFTISGTPSLIVHTQEGFIEPDMPGIVCHTAISNFPFLQYASGVKPSQSINLGRLFLVDSNVQYQKTITWNTDGSLTINSVGSSDSLIPLYRRITIPDGVTFA
jgi:hypothetical protein